MKENESHLQAVATKPQSETLNSILATAFLAVGSLTVSVCNAQNGSLDMGFLAEADYPPTAMALQSDGKIVLVGQFTTVNGVQRAGVARLNTDGTLDLGFNAGIQGSVLAVHTQPNSQLLIAGSYSTAGTNLFVSRLNIDGSLDTSLQTHLLNWVDAVVLQPDAKIIIGGPFSSSDGGLLPIVRLNSDGSLDATFNSPAAAFGKGVYSVAVVPDGHLVVIGDFSLGSGDTARGGIVRLNADGSLDLSFHPPLDILQVFSIVPLPGGNILMAGLIPIPTGPSSSTITYVIDRLNPDGTRDTAFNRMIAADGLSPLFHPSSLVVQNDGKIVVGSSFTNVNGVARTSIARLNADGTLDTTFSPGLGGAADYAPYVTCSLLEPDGKLVIGGHFSSVDGVRRINIARLNADAPSSPALSLSLYAGVTITGTMGGRYRVEYSSNLADSTQWTTLADLTLTNNPYLFIDTSAPASGNRFYRAVALP